MDQINLWILVPCVLIFGLVTIPVVYIWVSVYSCWFPCGGSKQSDKSEEVSDSETGTTEAPEQLSVVP
jgi:hypothetical protein